MFLYRQRNKKICIFSVFLETHSWHSCHSFATVMATMKGSVVGHSKGMTKLTIRAIRDLHEFSNIFSSEFNCSDIHDRVLCFEVIKGERLVEKDDPKGKGDSENRSKLCNCLFSILLFVLIVIRVSSRLSLLPFLISLSCSSWLQHMVIGSPVKDCKFRLNWSKLQCNIVKINVEHHRLTKYGFMKIVLNVRLFRLS